MDLSGIFINSFGAARVCSLLQMKNAAPSSHTDTDLSKVKRRGEDRTYEDEEEGEVSYVADSLAHSK